MSYKFVYPEFEVIRNDNRCINCRLCEKQCANEVHHFDAEHGIMVADETKCCQFVRDVLCYVRQGR